ncbi:MAG TPA: TIGR03668 family PPOX class F420-dependent oxidoreductase [Candidatus Tectomicrobia bacterium]|nr:TIGR03668 family PPOX class F420-dependent oxidoreductase [Candidatus Tectomicrobia bacterium]
MSRSDALLDELRAAVARARVARLATIGPGGHPHVVPICFALEGERLYSAVDRKPKRSRELQRLANVRADPRVEVLVDHYEEEWARLWWVRLRGRARVVDAGEELARALALLTVKYEQYRAEPPTGPALAMEIDAWSAWRAHGEVTR